MDKSMLVLGLAGLTYVFYKMDANKIELAVGVGSVLLISIATNSIIAEQSQKNSDIILNR